MSDKDATERARIERARSAAAAVADPELTFLTLADLGILRDVTVAADGAVEVAISPTYLGCPATDVISEDVAAALAQAQVGTARVVRALAPPWSTDWITPAGRAKLIEHGIAPPGAPRAGLFAVDVAACPRCGSEDARKVADFSSTPCKAQFVCRACGEPFEQFKCL